MSGSQQFWSKQKKIRLHNSYHGLYIQRERRTHPPPKLSPKASFLTQGQADNQLQLLFSQHWLSAETTAEGNGIQPFPAANQKLHTRCSQEKHSTHRPPPPPPAGSGLVSFLRAVEASVRRWRVQGWDRAIEVLESSQSSTCGSPLTRKGEEWS